MLDSIDISNLLKFEQEDFSCAKHRLPKDAVCRYEACCDRFLCYECIKEHDDSHIKNIIHDEQFMKSYIKSSVDELANQCFSSLEKNQVKRNERRNFLKSAFEKTREEILEKLQTFEDRILEVMDESSRSSSENGITLEECKSELYSLLVPDSKITNVADDLRLNLVKLTSIANVIKTSVEEAKIAQAIENGSRDFREGVCQKLEDLKASLEYDLAKSKSSQLGSLLRAEPKLMRKFSNRVASLSFSEKSQSLVVLEGYDKLNSFQNIHDLNSAFSRVDFDKFEDNVTKVKWISQDSYLLCNNNNKWLRVHHSSKTCSEFAVEGPIQKLDYCEKQKFIIVTTDSLVLCYKDENPRLPLYHKIIARTALTDSCIISKESPLTLALSHRNGIVAVYNVMRKREKFNFKAHESAVTSIVYWNSKDVLITAGHGGEAKIWKFAAGRQQMKCLQVICSPLNSGLLTNFVFIEKKNWMVIVYGEKNMVIYDCISNKKLGMRKFDSKIVNPCFSEKTGKLIFGMERNLYEIQL